ncbi:MAG TPA: DNA polymerase I [Gammaproteobacteria bacterium]|nr:DNA polymerase I [Gammaproteobacteria bacterium]
MPTKQSPLILVDGSSYLYRAFHALPALTNSKNFPTGAIKGMISMLKVLLNTYQPESIAVIFDAKGKTFRDELYKEYKATRKEMPSELVQQIEPIHQIIKAMGLPLISIPGVEADDVIGTLAKKANAKKIPVLISTGDKDIAQLVDDNITLINTMTNTILDPAGVKEKFGVRPDQIIDYLTLVGDTSDNVPGVSKVGPKTAVKWLDEYGSLDKIIANADKFSGKIGENLRDALSYLPLTKTLVTIKTDVELPLDINELKISSEDKDSLIELFKELEFKSWLSELLKDETSQQPQNDKYSGYKIIYDENDFTAALENISKFDLLAIDTETTSLDYMSAELVGVSFCAKSGEAYYVPFGHDYEGAPKQLSKNHVLSAVKPIFENPEIEKIGQNIKYDIEVLANAGVHVKGVKYDTMLESYVLDSTSNTRDMDSMALKYLGWQTISFEDVAGKGAKQVTFNLVNTEIAGKYAAEDADVTFRLHEELWPRIQKEKGLKHIFEKIEMPLVPVLAQIEREGVLIDPQKLRAQGKELQKRLDELEKETFAISGEEFNLNSPKQLQEILFDKLNLPVLQKTPTGQASTADAVLQELALDFAMPRLIIEYRSLSKLISTYTSKLVEQINPVTGRVHTSYNQTGTATGRLSSSDPNLQNIPVRTPEGRRIRQAFIAPENHVLISADYSQIELRLMAHISQDPGLLKAFANDIDIHKATASEVWGVSLDKVTNEMRRDAKAINFGLIYGMSAFGLTRQLGIDRHSAQNYIDKYFARYPKVKDYMDNTRTHAKQKGYVETLWGRRLYLPDINASKIPRQKAAERTAINAPLQGSAADIIKMAMIRIDRWLQEEKIPAKMIMQVHDELVFEVAEKDIEMVQKGIQEHMTHAAELSVPLLVSIGAGDNWDSASAH